MDTYQEKYFAFLLERFKTECLVKAQLKEKRDNEWKEEFISMYPRNAIFSMKMNDYLIAQKKYGNEDSFCRKICSVLKNIFHINVNDRTWAETFGIAIKQGNKLTLSKNLTVRFENNYDRAFSYIKNTIITLLNEIDRNNYSAIQYCELSYNMKYALLIIYCPEKILPICKLSLSRRYCENTGICNDQYKEIINYSNLLIQWKNDVPDISNWSYSIFTYFCDWLYRNNLYIDGNLLRKDDSVSIDTITEEIDGLNLSGESKNAIVKVRINQGIFREKLLCRFSSCCLCGLSNQDLLIASHIKPWSVSSPEEKLDVDNGFLMCPNHDKLFDQGWITFEDEGRIIITEELSEDDRIIMNVEKNMSILLTEKNKKYLEYHRKEIFGRKFKITVH